MTVLSWAWSLAVLRLELDGYSASSIARRGHPVELDLLLGLPRLMSGGGRGERSPLGRRLRRPFIWSSWNRGAGSASRPVAFTVCPSVW